MNHIVPITFKQACAFIRQVHRHHPAPTGMKFCLGVRAEGHLVGVAVAGRPVARMSDDTLTLEVTRVAVIEGWKNANSFLYGRVRQIAKLMGYERPITYTLPSESGVSLIAAGWMCRGEAGGGSWDRANRSRKDRAPVCTKLL